MKVMKISPCTFLAKYNFLDEDEEAIIDRLASLAAAVGPEALLTKPLLAQPPNYDLSQLGYLDQASDLNDEALAREAVLKLPRQFGYKPTDLRFYLPAETFAQYSPTDEQQQQQQFLSDNLLANARANQQWNTQMNNNIPQQQERVPLSVSPSLDYPVGGQPHHEGGGQHEVVPEGQSDFYFMKKKEQMDDGSGSPVRNYVPVPSHIMASEHSANFPRSQVSEKPFTYSDVYYIGMSDVKCLSHFAFFLFLLHLFSPSFRANVLFIK